MLKVDQGSLTLPQNILLNPKDHQKIIEAYFVYVSESAKAIRDALGSADVTDEQIDSDVRDLLQFEFEIANVLYICFFKCDKGSNSLKMMSIVYFPPDNYSCRGKTRQLSHV